LVIAGTDGYTAKQTDIDSAVIVAVLAARRRQGGHSVLDPRVQATVRVLEGIFKKSYPINQSPDSRLGLAYGRYPGDVYYGGNPWFLITADYARFYYRLAKSLQDGATFRVTEHNLAFSREALQASQDQLQAGLQITPVHPLHAALIAKFIEKGERIMRRLQRHTPADGQLYEQLDKKSGEPVSSPGIPGIGWAHASMINAILARGQLSPSPL
jgi:glucoamylase